MAQQEPEGLLELSFDIRGILEEHDLRPLWEVEDDTGHVLDGPDSDIWEWEDIQTAADAIEENVPIVDPPPRFQWRIAVPINMANIISNTIYVGIRTVSPSETIPSHRYGANALRFIIGGHEEMKTVVTGEEFPMKDNSLITTPRWEWCDHVNDGDGTAAWPGVLDLPLVFDSLNAKNTFEYHELDHQPATKTPGYWESQCRRARDHSETKQDDIPDPFEGERETTPPYRFRWDDTLEALRQRADNDTPGPHNGYSFSYVNPASRKLPLSPTVSFRAQSLQEETDPHSYNTTGVYFVIEGEGVTHVGDEVLGRSQWDVFVVAPNEIHHRDPDGETILLGMTGRPVFEAFNLYAGATPQ